jgi:hypothetical protein
MLSGNGSRFRSHPPQIQTGEMEMGRACLLRTRGRDRKNFAKIFSGKCSVLRILRFALRTLKFALWLCTRREVLRMKKCW